jgi:peptide deformylase
VPDPILNKKTEPVKQITPGLLTLIKNMMETSKKANGIGIAAPQVGRKERVCIIDLEHMGLPPFALVNPKISKASWKKVEMEEGCLSIPGIFGIVKRPAKVKLKTMTLEGVNTEFEADGLLARVIQHEIDHLDGILFTSKMIRQTSGKPDEKM